MVEEQENSLSIGKYINALLRHKLLFIMPFMFISAIGISISFKLPKMYKSSTLILLERQKVPENYVMSTTTIGVEERLLTLTQQIMSRTRLQKIIDEFELNNELKSRTQMLLDNIPWLNKKLKKYSGKKHNKEATLNLMRKSIKIDSKGYKKGTINYFSIIFTGRNPKNVMDITNRLASSFIEENLKNREKQVMGTTEFLDRELTNIKVELEEKEQAVKQFRQEYMGELPEQMQTNLRVMDQLQMRIQSINESLRNAKDRSLLIKTQLNNIISSAQGVFKDTDTYREQSITLLNIKLDELTMKYTKEHPDIKKIKKEIEEAKKKLHAEKKNKGKGNRKSKQNSKLLKTNIAKDPLYRTLSSQFKAIKREIQSLTRENKKLKIRLKNLNSKIENVPQLEQQLINLTRDYDLMKANYQSLFERKLQAKLSENLEKKQKGEQFKILDPANFPEKPFSPNLPKLIFISLLSGLGAGLGLVTMSEYFDSSFYDVEDLEKFTKLSVLASIPNMKKTTKN